MGLFRSNLVSLLFVDASRAVRLDVDARTGRVVDSRIRPRPPRGELAEAVELAMQSGARGARTWILSTEVWSHRLAVSASMIEGLSEAEVARALAFEAESLSGISAIDSEVGFVPLAGGDGARQLWVSQIPSRLRNQLQAAVQKAGGKLQGILHPAGLPASLSPEHAADAGSWSRVEAWPGLTVAVSANAGRVEHRFLNSDRRSSESLARETFAEALQAGGALPGAVVAMNTIRLDHDPSLIAWLAGWGAALVQDGTAVPAIKPLPQPVGNAAYVAASLAIAAVVGGWIAWDYQSLVRHAQTATAEAAVLNRRTEEQKTLNAELARLTKQIETTEAANKKIEQASSEAELQLAAERQRWQKLLRILANSTSQDLVIQEIASSNGIVTIRGKCLGTQATSESATTILEAVRSLGWLVTPRQKTNLANNLYDFSFQLEDVAPRLVDAPQGTSTQITKSKVSNSPIKVGAN